MDKLIKDYAAPMIKNMELAQMTKEQIITKLAHEYNCAMDIIYSLLMQQTGSVMVAPANFDPNDSITKQIYEVTVKG